MYARFTINHCVRCSSCSGLGCVWDNFVGWCGHGFHVEEPPGECFGLEAQTSGGCFKYVKREDESENLHKSFSPHKRVEILRELLSKASGLPECKTKKKSSKAMFKKVKLKKKLIHGLLPALQAAVWAL
ncbi:hypothetical protein AMTR_s00081p00164480 [Amborella trichopoda]|uniref:Uncharacterized protein n=1 Tax=Amborella trichopoda TaxID=13333 RepID=W1P9D5_AMBTC|nr:hypothetical protein AMTR_s00081p00164480 [Amborella trichopoda]